MIGLAAEFTSHYVSINSHKGDNNMREFKKFTSHYVSINSELAQNVIRR